MLNVYVLNFLESFFISHSLVSLDFLRRAFDIRVFRIGLAAIGNSAFGILAQAISRRSSQVGLLSLALMACVCFSHLMAVVSANNFS